jgi:hypothetical protein
MIACMPPPPKYAVVVGYLDANGEAVLRVPFRGLLTAPRPPDPHLAPVAQWKS